MFTAGKESITVITGQPANGKTTVGRLLQQHLGFVCIEGDDFITPAGKIRLNTGKWNDVDRRIYISRMAATAVEAKLADAEVVIVDCLTTAWMRDYLIGQIHVINRALAVGFILIDRELGPEDIKAIAQKRAAEGHALDISALLKYRHDFELWDSRIPAVRLTNPGDGDLSRLTLLARAALEKLWH